MNEKKTFSTVLICLTLCAICLTGGYVWGYFQSAADRQADYQGTITDLESDNFQLRAELADQGLAIIAANTELNRVKNLESKTTSVVKSSLTISKDQGQTIETNINLAEQIRAIQDSDASDYDKLRIINQAIENAITGD
jgi:hypothetical protein